MAAEPRRAGRGQLPTGPRRHRPTLPLPLPRTVRGKVAAAAALAMALLLAAGGIWLYIVLRSNLLDNTTGRTELAARKVAAQVDTGTARELLPPPDGGVDLVMVLDERGRVTAASQETGAAPELAGFRPPEDQDSASRTLNEGGRHEVAVVVRAQLPGGPASYVYGTTVLSDVDDATGAIGWALLASAPPLIALAAAIAWAGTGLALRPVTSIRTELAEVSSSELDRRVPDPGGADEIALLARTVNATLDRLEQAHVRQREFVADASHELRNPIAAVRSRLEVALAAPDSASVRAALDDTERLQRIAADLLLLARLDAHPQPPAEPVDLTLLAAEDTARRRAARVPVELAADAPVPVRGDPAQLERMLANLVDNAVRHARTRVRVAARRDGDDAVLEVTDDGPGVPAADRSRIFERFVRLDAARARESGGTGLGLAIAREIARAHGGELTAGAGPGATFTVRLPGRPEPHPRS
ncbi:sensor histidine kinase [Streptomyces sp. NPDC057910]|uniref:sensor histidine kinase n=1 Tax=Streptomyces sp. NPDC057910 TaxID=3346278 RepID=UPI0036E885AA